MQEGSYHVPVMLQQVIDGLQIEPSGTYVDCTFGGGGHSRAILEKLNEDGRLVAFDQDAETKKNLPEDERIIFVPQNFRHLQRFMRLYKILEVDGVLADLGVSSFQFNNRERGFSTRFSAEMDMRMDQRQSLTAAQILKNYSEERLHKLFEMYGEVTNAKTLAKVITEKRNTTSLQTIEAFKNAIHPIVKGNPNKYFAQVFQAIRIEVNDELGSLKEMLVQLPAMLRRKGRVAMITFHSLEDRIVKNFFKHGNFDDEEVDNIYGTKQESALKIITKKQIVPEAKEIELNPRARSAKLRIAEKK